MGPALLILVAAVVVAAMIYSLVGPHKRRQALATLAASMGWQYDRHDPFGMLRLPFPLFRRGDGRGTENLVWGQRDGKKIWVWDYWFYEESTDSKGGRSRSYSRFSCALTEVPMRAPHTSISRETMFTRIADAVGFRDIDLESEEFNRAIQLKSEDKRFATYLCDARMMEWLLANREWTFEVHQHYVLTVRHRLRPTEIPMIIEALDGFTQQMPKVVFETYGAK